ncbi:MAG: KaiC domain-containing protein [Candidatus Baldrarchaeia archaeon]
MEVEIERIPTGVSKLDELLCGGIPRGFFVAVTGPPGTGKTVLCIHFIGEGLKRGEPCIYVTTEESRESIVRQAAQFGMDFGDALEMGNLIVIDALMREGGDPWTLYTLDVRSLVDKIIEAKKHLGYGHARLVIDSLSAFWLDKPAVARRDSYFVKKVLFQWGFTILAVSQYAITTSAAFGFGVEHVADGIIRFFRSHRYGKLRRFLMIEKMRQTPHDTRLWEVEIIDGKGMILKAPTPLRAEDVRLPRHVMERIAESELYQEIVGEIYGTSATEQPLDAEMRGSGEDIERENSGRGR